MLEKGAPQMPSYYTTEQHFHQSKYCSENIIIVHQLTIRIWYEIWSPTSKQKCWWQDSCDLCLSYSGLLWPLPVHVCHLSKNPLFSTGIPCYSVIGRFILQVWCPGISWDLVSHLQSCCQFRKTISKSSFMQENSLRWIELSLSMLKW